MEVDIGGDAHLPSIYLPQTKRQAVADLPRKLTQLWGEQQKKKNFCEPSGQLPVSFQTEFDIINTSSLLM